MKILLSSLIAFACGLALGWRPQIPAGDQEVIAAKKLEKFGKVGVAKIPELEDEWAMWRARIEAAASSAELEGIFLEANGLPRGRERTWVTEFLQARWAEIDPVAGVEFFMAPDQWGFQTGMFCEWIKRDFESGVKGLEMANPSRRKMIESVVMTELLKRADSSLSLRYLQETGAFGRDSIQGSYDLWKEFAEARTKELTAVIEAALVHKKPQEMGAVLSLMGRVMAEDDPEGAISWALSLPQDFQGRALSEALLAWGQSDAKAVVARLAEWKKSGTGPADPAALEESLRYGLAVFLVDQDFAAAVQLQTQEGWSSSMAQFGRTARFGRATAARWRAGELDLAEIYGEVSGAEGASKYSLRPFFEALWEGAGRRDLRETVNFLQGQAESEVRTLAMSKLWKHALIHEPIKAAEVLAAMAPGESRNEIVRELFREDSAYGFHGNFLNALPPEVRAVGLAALYSEPRKERTTGDSRPLYPGEVVEGLPEIQDQAIREEAIRQVGWEWGGLDPERAMAWAAKLEGSNGENATREVARGWAEMDAASMAQSLETVPKGRSRDLMMSGLIEAILKKDPEGAWLWSETISDEALGREARAQAFEAWVQVDKEGAREALAKGRLGQNEQEALRAILKE